MNKTDNLIEELKLELIENMGSNKDEALNELARYKKEFFFFEDYNIYTYGNIRPYYSQIREFFAACKMKVSKNDEVMLARYKYYIREAVNELLKENSLKLKVTVLNWK